MMVAPCLTVKPHPDWSLVTEPPVYIIRSCFCLFQEREVLSLKPVDLLAFLDNVSPRFLAEVSLGNFTLLRLLEL